MIGTMEPRFHLDQHDLPMVPGSLAFCEIINKQLGKKNKIASVQNCNTSA